MKKFVLISLIGFLNLSFLFSYTGNIYKYFSKSQLEKVDKKVDSYFKNYFNSVQDLSLVFDKIYFLHYKIDKLYLKYQDNIAIKFLLDYIKEKIDLYKFKSLNWIKLNDKYISKNQVISLDTDSLYGFLGIRLKALYGDIFIKRLVFKNIYPDKIYSIKRVFIFSNTGLLLGDGVFNQNYVAITFYKPFEIKRNQEQSLYIRLYGKNIEQFTHTNKRLKFDLVNQYNGIQTLILSKYTGEPINYFTKYIDFNTWVFRKDQIYLTNLPSNNYLSSFGNKIYSFKVKSKNGYAKIYAFQFDIILNNVEISTGDYKVYINQREYKNVKIYALNKTGKTKLILKFPNLLDLGKNWKQIDIYYDKLKFTSNKNNYIVVRLANDGDTLDFVNGNYTGNWSIIYTDGSYKYLPSLDKYIFFTDKYLNYDLSSWVLEK